MAESNPPQPNTPSPEIRSEVIKEAKPFLLCMSCNAEFPPGSDAECPKCHVSLSVVRRCSGCQRILGAQHMRCPYCSTAFVPEAHPELQAAAEAAQAGPKKLSRRQIATIAGTAALFIVAIVLIVYRIQKMAPKPHVVMGQTYGLHETTLYRQPATTAPSIGDLQPGTVAEITDAEFDAVGNRWFEISSQGITSYVPAGEVAPPKGTDAENGFILLRHSLLSLDDPDVMSTQAVAAVDYYEKAFPLSPHLDEVQWLLADRSRALAERYGRQRTLLENAKALYTKLAAGKSEFAERARQALEDLPAPSAARPAYRAAAPRDNSLKLNIVGGTLTSSAKPPRTPGAPVRSLTVISRTPLEVLLPESIQLSLGQTFQGQVGADIAVNGDIAVPKGSACYLKVASLQGRASATLRLTTLVVDGQSYRVSAEAVRVKPAAPGTGRTAPSALPSGTRLTYRLNAPLVVTRS